MRAAVEAFRKAALRHPGFSLYFCVFRKNNRFRLAYLAGILSIFEVTKRGPAQRARHFRTMSYFLIGACIDETVGYASGPSATTPVLFEEVRRDFPGITAVGLWFSAAWHQATLKVGIGVLIRGIEADIRP